MACLLAAEWRRPPLRHSRQVVARAKASSCNIAAAAAARGLRGARVMNSAEQPASGSHHLGAGLGAPPRLCSANWSAKRSLTLSVCLFIHGKFERTKQTASHSHVRHLSNFRPPAASCRVRASGACEIILNLQTLQKRPRSGPEFYESAPSETRIAAHIQPPRASQPAGPSNIN